MGAPLPVSNLAMNPTEAVTFINMCLQTRLVPMLTGPPGIGKSSIVEQLAKKYRLKLIDIRLSQCDPCDLNGFPQVNGRRAKYLPMDTFPLEDDVLPKEYLGYLVFFDEFNSPSMAVQAAAYKIILDRKVGQHNLHPCVVMVCAGNRAIDGAIVNRTSTAMQSRLVHGELMVDHKIWSLWASSNKLSDKVISYINHRPDKLHEFNPNHNDKTFPCPRTWEFLSRLELFGKDTIPMRVKLPGFAGCVGEGTAREFLNYCDVYQHIPTYAAIKKDPKGISVTSEPSMLAALSGMVGSNVTNADLDQVMPYIYRLPIEFQAFALRDACKRNPTMIRQKEIADWLTVNSAELL